MFCPGQIDKYTGRLWFKIPSKPAECDYFLAHLEVADKINYSSSFNVEPLLWELKTLVDSRKTKIPTIRENCLHNSHMFYIKCRDLEERTKFISFMEESGIGCVVFDYIPLSSSPAGIKFGWFDD